MSEGVDYPSFVFQILLFYLFVVALIGYLIGSLLLKRQAKPVYVGVSSVIYCAFALLYLAVVNDKWSRTAPYENPIFWYSSFVVFWSLFIIPFMILTYAIKRLRLKHSKQRV
jgi:fucose permease